MYVCVLKFKLIIAAIHGGAIYTISEADIEALTMDKSRK